MARVVILVADGFTDSVVSVGVDVLRAANTLSVRAGGKPLFHTDVASWRGGRVRAASGLVLEQTVVANRAVTRADVVLAPSCWVETPDQMDALLLRKDVHSLMRTLVSARERGATIGAACGGTFLLAEAGLLDGMDATTTWWLAPHLRARRPAVNICIDESLVAGRDIITAGAVFAQADLALHLVSRFGGPLLARHVAKVLLLDAHASQARYMAVKYLTTNDRLVHKAERWVRAHLAEDLSIGALAKGVGTSTRTLSRRLEAAVGKSPIGFVQRMRVEAAVQLLETTRLSLQEVSEKVGYESADALRRLIKREIGITPKALRVSATRSSQARPG